MEDKPILSKEDSMKKVIVASTHHLYHVGETTELLMRWRQELVETKPGKLERSQIREGFIH